MTIEPAELQPGTQFAGKYRIERLIGKGGFGAVYEVSNELGWRQALKVLHPEIGANEVYRKRFLREMHIARDLMHENAVAVRDAGEYDGSLYYTMDFVDGKTISSEIKRLGKIEPSRAVEWALQVISFLEFLNLKGYLHRDLKPANIMIETDDTGRERVRVLDLGIARTLAADDESGQTMLTGGMIVGTPVYMAPEHIAGDEVDQRIDYYALGVILYECVAGAKPFTGSTVQRLYHAIHTETPQPLPKVVSGFPRDLWRVIERAMSKNREGRFPDAATFRMALAACRTENPTRDWEPTIMDTMIAPAQRQKWKMAAVGGGIGLLLLLLIFVVPGWFGGDGDGGDDANSPGTVSTPNGDAKKNAAGDADPSPTGPTVRLVLPPEERLRLPDRLVRVEVDAEGAPSFTLSREGGSAESVTPEFVDGGYRFAVPIPPGVVERRIGYQLAVRDDRGEEKVDFELLVDSKPPRVEQVRGPAGSTTVRFDASPVLIEVHASEALTRAKIDGEVAEIDPGNPRLARARVTLTGVEGQVLPIELVDLSGNPFDTSEYTLVVEGVTRAPVPSLKVTSPDDAARVSGSELVFRGSTVGSGMLHIDDQQFVVGAGPFEEKVPLERLDGRSKTFSIRFVPEGGADVPAQTRTVVIDNVAPTVVGEPQLSPAGAGRWRVIITGSEPLVRASVVCDGKPVPAPRIVDERSVEVTVDAGAVEVVLFDPAENRSETIRLRVGLEYALPSGCVPEPNSPLAFGNLPQFVRHKATGIVLTLVPPSPTQGFELAPFERGEKLSRVIADPFYLGVKEVSLAEFAKGRPADFDGKRFLKEPDYCDETHPVVHISWEEAELFCTERGLLLPTEAQWEWACRYEVEKTFGKQTSFIWGEDFEERRQWANLDGVEANAEGKEIGDELTTPVGSFKPTPTLGLYDMTGNVLEWCRNVSSSPGGDRHMTRGASLFARKAEWVDFRFRTDASSPDEDLGFRVVVEPQRR